MTRHGLTIQRVLALLCVAFGCFYDQNGNLPALAAAVVIHELGHFFVLKFFHVRNLMLRYSLAGLELNYAAVLPPWQRALALAGGPFAGGLYAALCLKFGNTFFLKSGAFSTVLTSFNLLPARPLDGGRLLEVFCADYVCKRCSLCVALLVLFLGTLFLIESGNLHMLLMGVWLLLYGRLLR